MPKTMKLSAKPLPIILVRGWGGTTVENEQRLTYQGFNVGTVYPHKKGPNYIYEGMILRFLKDGMRPYLDATNVIRYSPDKYVVEDPDNPLVKAIRRKRNSLWVYRYYDFQKRELPFYGEQLAEVIGIVKRLTGAPKVNIIAHSMGGLIVRWTLQKVYKTKAKAHAEVNKVVTLGTPHGGINFAWLAQEFPLLPETEYFDRGWLKKNLNGQDVSKSFDPEGMLCVVGTDHWSYEMWVSKVLAGKKSDGLVKQANASVEGAYKAYVHKCHGGNDSLVTSREAYELATRFFFGDKRVTITQNRARVVGKYERWWQGRPEYFVGFSLKPRGCDFFLNRQSKEAENCFGAFRSNKIGESLTAYRGILDTSRIKSRAQDDIAFRFDLYVGERDLKALHGFSDTIILEKNALFRYAMDAGVLEFYPEGRTVGEEPLTLQAKGGRGVWTFGPFEVSYPTYEAQFEVTVEDWKPSVEVS